MNTEFMLTIPSDWLIVFAVILACMVGALVACVVMLNHTQKRLEAIFEAVAVNLADDIECIHTDVVITKAVVDEIHNMTSDLRNDMNVCHDKLDVIGNFHPPKNEWQEPGEAVVLEERDVEEPSGDKFIDDFLAGMYDNVLKKASETTMNMTEAAASLMDLNTHSEYDVDDIVPDGDDGFDNLGEAAEKTSKIFEEVANRCADELDIHMISREEYLFGRTHEYGKFRMWYDTVKDILRQSNGLFNYEDFNPATAEFLGDGLRFFGVSSENKNVIYIRNHKLKADFMVEKASVIPRNGVEN